MEAPFVTLAELAVTRPGAHPCLFGLRARLLLRQPPPADRGQRRDPAGDRERGSGGRRPHPLATRPTADLVDFIERHYHPRLRTDLPEVIALADKVEQVHAAEKPTCPRGLAAHLRTMQAAVSDHLDKEEQGLFPLIRAGQGGAAGSPIHAREQEHVDHGRSLDRLRVLTANLTAPAEACPTWRALYLCLGWQADDLMEHIHLENNVLFPPRSSHNQGERLAHRCRWAASPIRPPLHLFEDTDGPVRHRNARDGARRWDTRRARVAPLAGIGLARGAQPLSPTGGYSRHERPAGCRGASLADRGVSRRRWGWGATEVPRRQRCRRPPNPVRVAADRLIWIKAAHLRRC
jgi:iron-sulfur cluster repair di-iron protein